MPCWASPRVVFFRRSRRLRASWRGSYTDPGHCTRRWREPPPEVHGERCRVEEYFAAQPDIRQIAILDLSINTIDRPAKCLRQLFNANKVAESFDYRDEAPYAEKVVKFSHCNFSIGRWAAPPLELALSGAPQVGRPHPHIQLVQRDASSRIVHPFSGGCYAGQLLGNVAADGHFVLHFGCAGWGFFVPAIGF